MHWIRLYCIFVSLTWRRVYNAVMNRDTDKERRTTSERNFCSKCSAMLWLYDSDWFDRILPLTTCSDIHPRPELLHPFSTAIDSPELPEPEEMVCISQPDIPRTNARVRSVCLWRRNLITSDYQRARRRCMTDIPPTPLKIGTRKTNLMWSNRCFDCQNL